MPKIKGVCDNRRGFTLVEIIVVLAIFSIVVVGGSSLLLSGNQVFKKNADMSHASQMAQYTIDWMEDSLTYSSVVEVTNGGVQVPAGMNAIKIQESGLNQGQLMVYKDGVWGPAFTAGFYEGWKIQIYPAIQATSLQLRLEIVNRQDEKAFEVTKTMSFPNMASSQNLKGSASTPYPMFLISSDVTLPDIEPPDPGDEEFENTPTEFAVGGNPNYVVSVNGSLNDYVQANYDGGRGAVIPEGSIYYDLEGFTLPSGEVLDPGYYVTRWNQYLKYPMSEEDIYLYLYGRIKQNKGEDVYKQYTIDSGVTVLHPDYIQIPYGQKINIDMDPENLPEPNAYTQPGDMKRVDDRFYVFFPGTTRWWHDYLSDGNWYEIDISILNI